MFYFLGSILYLGDSSRLLHVAVSGSLAMLCRFPLCKYSTDYSFYCDGCLDNFQFGEIMRNAAVNILLHIFCFFFSCSWVSEVLRLLLQVSFSVHSCPCLLRDMAWISLGYKPEDEDARSWLDIYVWIAPNLLQRDCSIHTPKIDVRESCICSTSSPALDVVRLLKF